MLSAPPTVLPRPAGRPGRTFRLALALFVGSIAFSIAGMLLLRLVPSSMRFFGPIYPQLVKAPTWTYMALLPILSALLYLPSLGWKRLAFFVAWGCCVGGAAELAGTTGLLEVGGVGLPFGHYAYTSWLGPKMAGHVPYFIPFSWFAMSILSLDLAGRIVPRRTAQGRLARIVAGAVIMVLWDVSLDPAMNRAFPFWNYPGGGFFFGMPLSNWIGWFGVTLVILAGYEYVGGGLRAHSSWAPTLYLLNCFFPLAICALQGMYWPVAIGAVATAAPLLLVRARSRPDGLLAGVPTDAQAPAPS